MYQTSVNRVAVVGCGLLASLVPSARAAAQPPVYTTLPPIKVTAQKEPEDPQNLPISVTAVSNDMLMLGALTGVSQAGWFAPNTFSNEFTARKLSNPRFRGVGASPSNPGVTSYIDGVPQLNANSSSMRSANCGSGRHSIRTTSWSRFRIPVWRRPGSSAKMARRARSEYGRE